jgi:hypothetical protein
MITTIQKTELLTKAQSKFSKILPVGNKKNLDECFVVFEISDTGIGISHGLALAASQSHLNFDCGLATTSLLESDVVTPPIEITAGTILVSRTAPDEKLVAKYLASADRRLWWQNRIERIWESGFGERWQSEQLN